ncbi:MULTISPECIES: hypothetical protein [unclassified Bradyrhizobium]|uniref:hypothetical protein n=1 Tax=unclassified Bradyrhizobium TaxID=2631580 RepID=UPI0028EFC332|nr:MULTISPECIES: hypothetical protein [unclassified Bradyrhizobium]
MAERDARRAITALCEQRTLSGRALSAMQLMVVFWAATIVKIFHLILNGDHHGSH